MNQALPLVYLVRHTETAWTLTGQHAGRIDLALTAQWEREARALGVSLGALRIDRVLSSSVLGYDHDLTEPLINAWNGRVTTAASAL